MAQEPSSPLRVTVYSARDYDEASLIAKAQELEVPLTFNFTHFALSTESAHLSASSDAVCLFVNDDVSADVVAALASNGVRLIAMRCAGFDRVDLAAAAAAGIAVTRVPAYSPHAVAEHAVALMMSANRKTHRAYHHVRDHNFTLNSGLLGFDMFGKTIGVVGTGKIGRTLAEKVQGFGMTVLLYDVFESPEAAQLGTYVSLDELLARSDIISLHCPLLPATTHMISDEAIGKMKNGVMIINTSRGKLIDTAALIRGIKSKKVGSVGIDVYEEEDQLFFEDRGNDIIMDDVFERLLSFPNVLVTGHQAFFTREALDNIGTSVVESLKAFTRGEPLANQIEVPK